MNLLFILGNGFDINLGLKTGYADFRDYYLSQDPSSASKVIDKLKLHIEENENQYWSDLELALGKYTAEIRSREEFEEIYIDLQDKLADYLDIIDDSFEPSDHDLIDLFNHLIYPERHLLFADRTSIEQFKSLNNSPWNINTLTFNYTRIFEKLINYSDKTINLNNKHENSHPTYFNSIQHIHGTTDDRMIIGVNDVSQVSNKNFHSDQGVLNSLIKAECHIAHRHNTESKCTELINDANLVCIFGSSLGETDKYWWEKIGDRLLASDCRLIIFSLGTAIHNRRPQMGLPQELKIKTTFLDKTSLDNDEKNLVMDKIYVSVNSGLFKPEHPF